MLLLTEVTDGVISYGNATLTVNGTANTAVTTQTSTDNIEELITTLNNTSGTDTGTATDGDTANGKTIHPTDARGDVVNNEAEVEGVVTTAAVAAKDRTSWLD